MSYKILYFFGLMICATLIKAQEKKFEYWSLSGKLIKLPELPDLINNFGSGIESKEELASTLKTIEFSNVSSVVSGLKKYKDQLGLNDWLLYYFIDVYVSLYYSNFKPSGLEDLIRWKLLSAFGYDVRIVLSNSKILLYVESSNGALLPSFKYEDKNYFCLNCDNDQESLENSFNLSTKLAIRTFQFSFKEFPNFKMQPIFQSLTFQNPITHQSEQIDFTLNHNIITALDTYPSLNFYEYTKIPILDEGNKVLERLNGIISQLSLFEAVIFLRDFVQEILIYEPNGKKKLFTPYTSIYYNDNLITNSLDSSILFIYLVEQLLGLETIAVVYQTPSEAYTKVGVSINEKDIDIIHEGRGYRIFETSNEVDESMNAINIDYKILPRY